jgi:putative ABC transport system permease protein
MQSSLFRVVRLGIRSLLLHRLRSLLTTLGVLFGTSSVIAMLAIGEGASAEAQDQIRQLGSQNVILRSVKPAEDQNVGNERARVVSYGLTHADHRRIQETFPGLREIVPVRELMQEVRHLDRVMQPRVMATVPEFHRGTGRLLREGRFLSHKDEQAVANVAVIGSEVGRRLFPLRSPLGAQIRIGGDYFLVVGVLEPRVRQGSDPARPGSDTTGEVFIPFETGKKWFGDIQVRMRAGSMDMEEVQLHEIILAVERPDDVEMVADAAREMLTRFHREMDYEVVVPLELLARAEETKRIFNIVLGSIAGISLLVGGIGIMNVMLATVTERTREIGIRRALGAKRRHIVTQFLAECVVLSVGGGALGVMLGLAIPAVVEHYADMRTVVTPAAPILAFTISAAIGVVFGLYPAWRAARMDPVEALRHE